MNLNPLGQECLRHAATKRKLAEALIEIERLEKVIKGLLNGS